MKTLVYFASGPPRPEYRNLDYDRIILVDNCFKNSGFYHRRTIDPRGSIFMEENILCIGMDCLQSISYLKELNVTIDCFVSLNEGLYEGGGSYAINSDFFLGYVMPLLKDEYIHIMNKNYYGREYKVSMDLPYAMQEILEGENDYLSPFIFSKDRYHEGHAKVFRMKKVKSEITFALNSELNLSIIHDSIWNHYDSLGLIVSNISQQGQGRFFEKIDKTYYLSEVEYRSTKLPLQEIFAYCKSNEIKRIGFIPWARGQYRPLVEKLLKVDNGLPNEVVLFHLNKNDYRDLKAYLKEKFD
jgi:hypothetical protein